MKTVKPILAAAIFSLALSIPAYAGIIHTPGCTEPPPPPATSGQIGSPGFAEQIFLALLSLVI
ncbi:MAG: hypothetical protein ACR2IB_00660 [Pyrinomonadaceae bacterium]